MYSRDEWNRLREAKKKALTRLGFPLVWFSVPGGIIQLAIGKWMDRNLDKATRTPYAVGMFLFYITVVVFLLWRYVSASKQLLLKCPSCGVAMKDMAENVASATGRCEKCGGQVIAS